MLCTPREALITSFPVTTVPDKHLDLMVLVKFALFVTDGKLKLRNKALVDFMPLEKNEHDNQS